MTIASRFLGPAEFRARFPAGQMWLDPRGPTRDPITASGFDTEVAYACKESAQ